MSKIVKQVKCTNVKIKNAKKVRKQNEKCKV